MNYLIKEDLIQKLIWGSSNMISATLIPVQMKIDPLLVKVIHKENGGVLRQVAFGLQCFQIMKSGLLDGFYKLMKP